MSGAYRWLEDRFRRLSDIDGAIAILSWDQAVWMPQGGAEARARQLATLRRLAHELLTHPEVGERIAAAEGEAASLDDWQRANLAAMRHRRLRAAAVDVRLVEQLAHATTRAEMVWREARARDDFELLSPHLEEVFALVREQAAQLAPALGLEPYDALLDGYQPGLTAAAIERLFAPLERLLPDAIEDAMARQREPLRPRGPFPPERQKALFEELMRRLGFDFAHGRLDESAHPFCGGTPTDIRVTTRYDRSEFTSGLMAVLHETGHALYEAGLPRQWLGQPVGEARGMAVHESQSLLVEMQLSRSGPFLRFLADQLAATFGPDPAFEAGNLQRLYHRVARGFIRVDADELTYPLHVILRYRLERALLAGGLAVADLPRAWREGMRDLLGVVPPNDRLGVLQDIHWPLGIVGYFPCYTVGALLAAQLFEVARAELPDLDEETAAGRFDALLAWLRARVHRQGSRWSFEELVRRASGRALEVTAFLRHLERRYGVLPGAGRMEAEAAS